MTRSVLKIPNKKLSQPSSLVTVFDDKLCKLVVDMRETMNTLGGVGLAAIQIGTPRQVVLVKVENKPLLVLINAKITQESEELQDSYEACLSIPGVAGTIKRPRQITIEYQDVKGESFKGVAVDEEARVICHEIDHTNGILFTSKL